jgi:hypothetical protein
VFERGVCSRFDQAIMAQLYSNTDAILSGEEFGVEIPEPEFLNV